MLGAVAILRALLLTLAGTLSAAMLVEWAVGHCFRGWEGNLSELASEL